MVSVGRMDWSWSVLPSSALSSNGNVKASHGAMVQPVPTHAQAVDCALSTEPVQLSSFIVTSWLSGLSLLPSGCTENEDKTSGSEPVLVTLMRCFWLMCDPELTTMNEIDLPPSL